MSGHARSSTQQILFASLLLLSLVIVYFASRMFIGSLSAYQAQLFLDDWQEKKGLTSEQAYKVANDAAKTSILWYPVNNGSYWQRLGQIEEWRHYTLPFGDNLAQDTRKNALQAYRQAVTYKSVWPYLWARHANVKLQLLELDEEFIQALHRIDETGRWRPLATRELVEIGFLAWPLLDHNTRQLVLEAASRTAAANASFARDVEASAKHTGMTDTLCEFLSENAKDTRHLCQ